MLRLLFTLLLALPLCAWSGVGKIDSFAGDARVAGSTGVRTAAAGLDVEEGDVVTTSANAWVLIEMNDGASITMRPSTEVRISRYRYTPDGAATQNSSVLDLAKGALRVITGLIGKSNSKGYSINTATATMGVRGTDHEPAYYPEGHGEGSHAPGTYDKVNEGETFIRGANGQEVSVRRGAFAYAPPGRSAMARVLSKPPAFYARHAEHDKLVAARREALHKRVLERQQQRLHDRQDKMQKRLHDKAGLHDKKHDTRQDHHEDAKSHAEVRREAMREKAAEREMHRKKMQEQRDYQKGG